MIQYLPPRHVGAKRAVITLGAGSLESGFPAVSAFIFENSDWLPTSVTGHLPPAPEMLRLSHQLHKQRTGQFRQLERIKEVKNLSIQNVRELDEKWKRAFNGWLAFEGFRTISDKMREKCHPSEEIHRAFSRGTSLYLAVREARERLQVFDNRFLGASWLPILYQNLAEDSMRF